MYTPGTGTVTSREASLHRHGWVADFRWIISLYSLCVISIPTPFVLRLRHGCSPGLIRQLLRMSIPYNKYSPCCTLVPASRLVKNRSPEKPLLTTSPSIYYPHTFVGYVTQDMDFHTPIRASIHASFMSSRGAGRHGCWWVGLGREMMEATCRVSSRNPRFHPASIHAYIHPNILPLSAPTEKSYFDSSRLTIPRGALYLRSMFC